MARAVKDIDGVGMFTFAHQVDGVVGQAVEAELAGQQPGAEEVVNPAGHGPAFSGSAAGTRPLKVLGARHTLQCRWGRFPPVGARVTPGFRPSGIALTSMFVPAVARFAYGAARSGSRARSQAATRSVSS